VDRTRATRHCCSHSTLREASDIPEDDREVVFETWYSASEVGTGFGLRIVEQVAEAPGWEIRVTESEQGGARFDITGVEFADH
jgi:K+-sensing histidine kinase KdpD